MLAFSLLSLVIEPLCLSGAMPILSCFLALLYLQNGFRSFFSRLSVMMLFKEGASFLLASGAGSNTEHRTKNMCQYPGTRNDKDIPKIN
jgi:hypothetical protein